MRNVTEKIIHHVHASKGNHPTIDIKLYSLGNQTPYFSITSEHGSDHDHIAGCFPELTPFIALHLSTIDGTPMYAEENGFYHYAEGVKENGKPCYFPSEEAKKNEGERLNNATFLDFQQATRIEHALARDIWESMDAYSAWKKCKYESELFKTAQHFYNNKPSVITALVVERNNEYLASHLRISLEEASAIPTGLTKAEFIRLHVEPHRERWRSEANAAIALLKEWEALYPPFDDEIEEGQHYYFGAKNYRERFLEIVKRRTEQRAYRVR